MRWHYNESKAWYNTKYALKNIILSQNLNGLKPLIADDKIVLNKLIFYKFISIPEGGVVKGG